MMRIRSFGHLAVVTVLAALAFAGCQKKEAAPPPVAEMPKPVPFRVVSMDLGKRLDADKKIAEPAVVFGVRDTIHFSIASEGTSPTVTPPGPGTLSPLPQAASRPVAMRRIGSRMAHTITGAAPCARERVSPRSRWSPRRGSSRPSS